jgi:hypothetical protein
MGFASRWVKVVHGLHWAVSICEGKGEAWVRWWKATHVIGMAFCPRIKSVVFSSFAATTYRSANIHWVCQCKGSLIGLEGGFWLGQGRGEGTDHYGTLVFSNQSRGFPTLEHRTA